MAFLAGIAFAGGLAYLFAVGRMRRPGVFALTVVACLLAVLTIALFVGAGDCQDRVREQGGDCEGYGVAVLFSAVLTVVFALIAGLTWALGERRD